MNQCAKYNFFFDFETNSRNDLKRKNNVFVAQQVKITDLRFELVFSKTDSPKKIQIRNGTKLSYPNPERIEILWEFSIINFLVFFQH